MAGARACGAAKVKAQEIVETNTSSDKARLAGTVIDSG